jgi:uncharacterized membrane protein YhhN
MSIASNTEKGDLKRVIFFLFILCLLADLVATGWQKGDWRFFSKPLLMPLLTGYFLLSVSPGSVLKKYITAALVFSWAGDVLLMFEGKESVFFLLGLSSFLIAHIFYILFYHQVRVKENIKNRWWLLIIVAVYYAALISLLYPYLADMKIPVPVYGIVISFMLLLALHMLFIRQKTAGRWMTAGAVLFILSDSILAINKFYQPFSQAGFLIMLTYGLAQLFIITGAIQYISSARSESTSPA